MITRSKLQLPATKYFKLNYDEIDTLQFVHNGYNSLLYQCDWYWRVDAHLWLTLSQQLASVNGRHNWLDMETYTHTNHPCMQRKSNFNTKTSLNNLIANNCMYFQMCPILWNLWFFNENSFDTQKNAEHSTLIETRLCKLFIQLRWVNHIIIS